MLVGNRLKIDNHVLSLKQVVEMLGDMEEENATGLQSKQVLSETTEDLQENHDVQPEASIIKTKRSNTENQTSPGVKGKKKEGKKNTSTVDGNAGIRPFLRPRHATPVSSRTPESQKGVRK